MKISIVTISFNQAAFLERTIVSVLSQKKTVDLDYIVIDAGSTDGSRTIIEKYKQEIDQVVLEPDEGPSDGLNKGFSLACGEIFGFLNSDDILYPDSLAKALNFLDKNPKIDVVSGHAFIIDSKDNVLRKSYSQPMKPRQYAYGACIVNQPSTFFKKSAYELTNGFNKKNRCNWDGELFVDMALAGARFDILDDFLSGYRLHNVSITASAKLDLEMHKYHARIFNKIMGRPPKAIDSYLSLFYRGVRFANNPKALLERLHKGKIYGRSLTNT